MSKKSARLNIDLDATRQSEKRERIRAWRDELTANGGNVSGEAVNLLYAGITGISLEFDPHHERDIEIIAALELHPDELHADLIKNWLWERITGRDMASDQPLKLFVHEVMVERIVERTVEIAADSDDPEVAKREDEQPKPKLGIKHRASAKSLSAIQDLNW